MNQNDSDAAIDARSVNSEDDGELEMMVRFFTSF